MRASQLSGILATWVSVIAAIVGGYVALNTYTEDSRKRVDERNKQTFELVQLFMSEHIMPIRAKALAQMRSVESCKPVTDADKMSDSEYFAFVEFFEIVDLCVVNDMCDRKLVDAFFVPYANGHWPAFKAGIMATRQGEEQMGIKPERPFGAGLEHLAVVKVEMPKCMTR